MSVLTTNVFLDFTVILLHILFKLSHFAATYSGEQCYSYNTIMRTMHCQYPALLQGVSYVSRLLIF